MNESDSVEAAIAFGTSDRFNVEEKKINSNKI